MDFIKKIWQKVSALGIDNSMERTERKRVRILNQINVLLFLEVPLFMIVHLFTNKWLSLILLFIGIGFLSNLLLNKNKKFSIARTGTFFWFWITVSLFCVFLGEKSGIVHTFYLLALLPFVIYPITQKARIAILVVIALISFFGFYAVRLFYDLERFVVLSENEQNYLFIPVVFTVFTVLCALVGTFAFHNQESEKELLQTLKETEQLNTITQEQNEELATTEKALQEALRQVEKDKEEIVVKNNELQAQEEEMRQTVEELTSVNEQMKLQEEKLRVQVQENKLQLYQIEQQEDLMRSSFEELQEKTEQMEAQEAIMQQAMIEMNRINEELQVSEQRLEKEVERRTAQIASQNKALEHSYLALESKTRTLHQSINYAKHIQNAILPPKMIVKALFSESFVFYKPKDIVSGDFYWVDRKINSDGNMRIAIAAVDCTGHGVPGAIMSMIGYNLLNQFSNQATLEEPHLLVEKLHNGVIQSLQQEHTENRDGMDLSICVYDSEKQTIDFVGAKNPLIYIQDNQLQEIKGTNASVGGAFYKQKKIHFEKHTIDVSKPTTIYLYSDGYQDQFGGKKGRKFMKSKFKKLLFDNHQKTMEEQSKLFRTTFNKWKEDEDQVDDVLLIGLKINS
ncbi:SpoIIE family protein phosphatase [Bernardetia sp. Wsw4-3y2]|uniref:SpoIIE family protein phosphatase n=1 Tax=Bernardetia sp. Wsw4-3y2 TaxID=3127471 RepID=UPI0030D41866